MKKISTLVAFLCIIFINSSYADEFNDLESVCRHAGNAYCTSCPTGHFSEIAKKLIENGQDVNNGNTKLTPFQYSSLAADLLETIKVRTLIVQSREKFADVKNILKLLIDHNVNLNWGYYVTPKICGPAVLQRFLDGVKDLSGQAPTLGKPFDVAQVSDSEIASVLDLLLSGGANFRDGIINCPEADIRTVPWEIPIWMLFSLNLTESTMPYRLHDKELLFSRRSALIDILLKYNPDVNVADSSGVTPLMNLLVSNDGDILTEPMIYTLSEKLLKAGANPNVIDTITNETPLMRAKLDNLKSVVKLLKSYGAIH